MEIKWTVQGFLIYLSMAGYLGAFVTALLGKKRAGERVYLGAFWVAIASYIYRWSGVGHVPMQNLFEVFLCLGMIYPVSVFCRRFLGVDSYRADMLLGVVVLMPAGFVFSAQMQQLPPALQSPLFVPHVGVYVLAYVFMFKAAIEAGRVFGRNSFQVQAEAERASYKMVCVGFPLLTAGLLLGSVWGKLAWGDWWGWDPKELWSLASWLVYVGYLHFRAMSGAKKRRVNAGWVIVGAGVIVITLLWVNLARVFSGLHSYAT